MRVAVIGAAGEMGSHVQEVLNESEHSFVFGIDPDTSSEDVYSPESLGKLLEENSLDAVIDFSVPESCIEAARTCAEHGVPFVTGTTGLDKGDNRTLENLSENIPILHASNFAPGVKALRDAVVSALESVPEYDIEVTETHHNRKQDAPSGTAKTIIDDIETAAGKRKKKYGREGEDPREDGEIGVHVRRAGNIKGEHEVMLAGNEEVISIKHRAESRKVFAAGSVKAAEWLQNQENGYYSFEDTGGN